MSKSRMKPILPKLPKDHFKSSGFAMICPTPTVFPPDNEQKLMNYGSNFVQEIKSSKKRKVHRIFVNTSSQSMNAPKFILPKKNINSHLQVLNSGINLRSIGLDLKKNVSDDNCSISLSKAGQEFKSKVESCSSIKYLKRGIDLKYINNEKHKSENSKRKLSCNAGSNSINMKTVDKFSNNTDTAYITSTSIKDTCNNGPLPPQDIFIEYDSPNINFQSSGSISVMAECNDEAPYERFQNSSQTYNDSNVTYNSSGYYQDNDRENIKNCSNETSGKRVYDLGYTKVRSPPSYAAHFSGTIAEINSADIPVENSSSAKILPPYKQTCIGLSGALSNILNNSHLKDNSPEFSYYSPDSSPCHPVEINDQCHLSENTDLNISQDGNGDFHISYPTEQMSQMDGNCDDIVDCTYPRDEPRDYSSNSISIRKAKEDIQYVNEFLESLEQIKFNEKQNSTDDAPTGESNIYLERKKLAQYSLKNSEEGSRRSEILKSKFWIIDDEPIVHNDESPTNHFIPPNTHSSINNNKSPKKIKTPKELICHICGNIFRGRSSLKSHIALHNGVKAFKCTYCPSSFVQSSALKAHIRTHTKETPYKCSMCSSSFKTLSGLKQHNVTHSDLRMHSCSICQKSFKTEATLKSHVKLHSSGPFSCKECPAVFGRRQALSKHSYMAHRVKECYKCDICPKSYNFKSLLVQHKRIHTGDDPYCCSTCGASFVWKSGYTSHLKSHMMKLACDICQVKLLSLKKLYRHKLKHSNPKMYSCEKCGKSFKENYLMQAHMKRHKSDLECHICGVGFLRKSKLKIHLLCHDKPQVDALA